MVKFILAFVVTVVGFAVFGTLLNIPLWIVSVVLLVAFSAGGFFYFTKIHS